MVFIELPIFIRCAADLFTDDDIVALQVKLLKDPEAGDLIPGSHGLRKLRVPLSGRGKRGGSRVIYYYWASMKQCYLLFAYDKSASEDLTHDQLRRLSALIHNEVHHG